MADVLSRSLAVGLTLAALAWVAVIVTAPLLLSHAGSSPVLAAVYGAAGMICHQRPERSFTIAGSQVPVCARCSGLYVAGAAGAIAAWIVTAHRVHGGTRAVRVALALAAAPTAITWAAEALGLFHPSNMTRAVAALPLGAAAGWIFVRMLASASDPGGLP